MKDLFDEEKPFDWILRKNGGSDQELYLDLGVKSLKEIEDLQ